MWKLLPSFRKLPGFEVSQGAVFYDIFGHLDETHTQHCGVVVCIVWLVHFVVESNCANNDAS
jgi:hypothetical protein